MEDNIIAKEEKLKARLESIREMEKEVVKREKALKDKEKSKKQVLLRLSPSLWNDRIFASRMCSPTKKQVISCSNC